MDLVFLIDGSGSTRPERFPRVQAFVADVVSRLAVSRDHVRVGVVVFGESVTSHFTLQKYFSKQDIMTVRVNS